MKQYAILVWSSPTLFDLAVQIDKEGWPLIFNDIKKAEEWADEFCPHQWKIVCVEG